MFADVDFADEYFSKRAFAGAWAVAEDKENYLALASNLIDEYCLFYDESGAPCSYDEDAPDWLKRAASEQALYLLNLGKDPTQADKKTTLGIARTDDGTTFDKSFSADILSPVAVRIITKYGGEVLAGAVSNSASGGHFTK